MSKQRDPASQAATGTQPKTKANPLAGIGRKPTTYVGDLDSLLAEVGDGPVNVPGSDPAEASAVSAPQHAGGEEAPEVKPPMKRINLDVPVEFHQRFKGVTSMQGVTMTEVIQRLIAEYVDEASGMFR